MSSSNRMIAFITGGNNGIGLETCRLLASQPGWHVVMGSRSIERGQQAVEGLKRDSPSSSVSLVQIEVTSDDSIQAAARQIESAWGKLDLLINNAGVCPTESSRSSMQETFNVNCASPAIVTQTFAHLLQKSSSPRIIYVSSRLGSITQRSSKSDFARGEEYKDYRISKAALNMLVACDAWRYEKDGIKAFAYCPGFVVSDLAGMRQKKVDMGVPTPENSAQGLLAIANGSRDQEAGSFLHGTEPSNVYEW